MKILLLLLMGICFIGLLGLSVFSIRLLRKIQKEAAQQGNGSAESKQYKIHPGVEQEHQRLDALKKHLEKKAKSGKK